MLFRSMEWIFGRCMGTADAVDTPIGLLPIRRQFNMSGLAISERTKNSLLDVPKDAWLKEIERHGEFLKKFGNHLPAELRMIHNEIKECLERRW